jgi:hypothetical protein
MSETKPARRFIAEARPVYDHDQQFWGAYWAFPGMVPAWVTDQADGLPLVFERREDASLSAKLALANALLHRFATSDLPERYRHMAAANFAADLRETGITPTRFARVYGVSQSAVMAWINGVSARPQRGHGGGGGGGIPIPHAARVLLALFLAYPDAVDVAERVTAENTTPRHEFAEEVTGPAPSATAPAGSMPPDLPHP